MSQKEIRKNIEMNFGFSKQDRDRILSALLKFPEIEKAIVFGSRAMGNSKKGSDVDLAILGKNITSKTRSGCAHYSIKNCRCPIFSTSLYMKISPTII